MGSGRCRLYQHHHYDPARLATNDTKMNDSFEASNESAYVCLFVFSFNIATYHHPTFLDLIYHTYKQ